MPGLRLISDRLARVGQVTWTVLTLAVLTIALSAGASPRADEGASLQLVMIEEDGCGWCRRWNEEIAPIYPKTSEGARAPLRRLDLDAPRPPDLAGMKPTRFTPTFVLVADGREVGRITGYPGEDFFWGLLQRLIEAHDRAQNAAGS